eukprot:8479144-Pyramimonas_sp.AAC.1
MPLSTIQSIHSTYNAHRDDHNSVYHANAHSQRYSAALELGGGGWSINPLQEEAPYQAAPEYTPP